MWSIDERRAHHRVRIEGVPVQVRPTDVSGWLDAELVDLSAGGVAFRIGRDRLPQADAWPVGQRLAVHIVPTISITDPLSVIVAVTDRLTDETDPAVLFHCQTLDFLPEESA